MIHTKKTTQHNGKEARASSNLALFLCLRETNAIVLVRIKYALVLCECVCLFMMPWPTRQTTLNCATYRFNKILFIHTHTLHQRRHLTLLHICARWLCSLPAHTLESLWMRNSREEHIPCERHSRVVVCISFVLTQIFHYIICGARINVADCGIWLYML